MATHFLDISAALSGRLNSLSGLPPVAWMNQQYEPEPGTLFLRETLLPADVYQVEQGESGRDLYSGIYQVAVFSPSDEGKNAAIVQADAIADHFSRGTILTYNSIRVRITRASLGASNNDRLWWIVPVNIRYQSYLLPR